MGRPALFDYDPGEPLEEELASAYLEGDAEISEGTYRGSKERLVSAFLVEPVGRAPAFGTVYVHPGPGDRSSFLGEAKEMASKGAASLLIDAPWADPRFGEKIMGLTIDGMRDMFVQTAVDIRRGVDVMASQHPVEIAYVGHSFGALFGGILSSVERRFKALVLMSGVGSFTDVAALNMPGADPSWISVYRKTMEPIDPINYLPSSTAPILFQFGLNDQAFSSAQFEKFSNASGGPKEVRWYDADHFSVGPIGRPDRTRWLEERMVRR